MLFIPQEVKDQIAALEAENQSLREALDKLGAVPTPAAKRGNGAVVAVLIIALVLALAAVGFLLFFQAKKGASQPDAQVVLLRDGKIEKWNKPEDGTIVFRVQIGAYQNFDLSRYKQNLEGLQQDSIDGFHKISLGAFSRIADAQAFQAEMEKLGLQNVYIVAYQGNTPIGLIEAAKQQNP